MPDAETVGPINDGMVRLEPFVMKRLLLAREWTIRDYCKETDMQMRTAKKVFGGERIQISTARFIAREFGVKLLDIADPSDYTPPTFTSEAKPEIGTGEWVVGKPLSEVLTTGNGLQYRVYPMTNAFEAARRGRGKRYELNHLSDDAKQAIRHRLSRHLSVCERLTRHAHFPICYTTFPDSDRDAWWVIDEWIDGKKLSDVVDDGPVPEIDLSKIACELAEAIAAAHRAGIVLRELSPTGVLMRESDGSVVLTDFELAKLSEDFPTVSSDHWIANDYRAPEVGAGTTKPLADVYSWGRVITHATLGKLPAQGEEERQLKFSSCSREWMSLLVKATQLLPSKRPNSIEYILKTLKQLRP